MPNLRSLPFGDCGGEISIGSRVGDGEREIEISIGSVDDGHGSIRPGYSS